MWSQLACPPPSLSSPALSKRSFFPNHPKLGVCKGEQAAPHECLHPAIHYCHKIYTSSIFCLSCFVLPASVINLEKKKKKKIQSLPPFEASSPIHELTNFYTAWCERLNKYPLKNFLVMFLCFPLGDSLLPGCRAASRKSCFCSQKKQEGTKSTFNTSYLKMKHVWFNQVTYITASTDWHFVLLSFLREN